MMAPSRLSVRASRCTDISDRGSSSRHTNSVLPMNSRSAAFSLNVNGQSRLCTRVCGSTVAIGSIFSLGELLIIEIKAVERLLAIHQAQVLTYLKLTGIPAALLVNFNAITLKTGLRRLTRKRDLLLPSFPPSCSSSA